MYVGLVLFQMKKHISFVRFLFLFPSKYMGGDYTRSKKHDSHHIRKAT